MTMATEDIKTIIMIGLTVSNVGLVMFTFITVKAQLNALNDFNVLSETWGGKKTYVEYWNVYLQQLYVCFDVLIQWYGG